MQKIFRRTALTGLADTTALPAYAQTLDATESAAALDQLQSFLMLKDGEEVIAMAPRGPGLDRVANVKSVSKTLLSLVTGAAIDRDLLSTEDRVLEALGRRATGDARDVLTVGHLLSMQTGLPSTSGGNYGQWIASPDWVDYVLDAAPVAQPGGRFIYSTGTWHVLSAVLSEATGRDVHALANDWLGDPLGIDIPRWERDPQGRYMGGNQMGLTPRALARVGEMVRQRGVWNGERVLSEAWLDASWERRTRSRWSGDGYGYGWFLSRIAGEPVAYGRGYGGQILAVAPRAGVTMVITSDPTRPARSGGYFTDLERLMGQALTEAATLPEA
ncbi:MAG: serine hydrolase domain-containing protein [Shimia sp.]